MTAANPPPNDPRPTRNPLKLARRMASGGFELAKLEAQRGRQEITENLLQYRTGVILLALAFGFVILGVFVLMILLVLVIAALTGVPGLGRISGHPAPAGGAGSAVRLAGHPQDPGNQLHARRDHRGRQGGPRVGETLAETRLEIDAKKAELERTSAQLREALDIQRLVKENPLPIIAIGATGAFLIAGGPQKLAAVVRRRFFPSRVEKTYDSLPKPMQSWVDHMAGAVGPRAEEARDTLAAELAAVAIQPPQERQDQQEAREADRRGAARPEPHRVDRRGGGRHRRPHRDRPQGRHARHLGPARGRGRGFAGFVGPSGTGSKATAAPARAPSKPAASRPKAAAKKDAATNDASRYVADGYSAMSSPPKG